MPGNTWRDLQKNSSSKSPQKSMANAPSADVSSLSPQLVNLQKQREELQEKMHKLTSGVDNTIDPRDAARFQVSTFAERRAQQREWEDKRNRLQEQSTNLRHLARTASPRERSNNGPNQASTVTDSVNQWLNHRDTQRSGLRDVARDRLSPLNDVTRVGRQLNDKLSGATRQLQSLDQQLAEHGLDKEREELRALGADKLNKASSQINKYTEMADAPMRAINKLDSAWESRQQKISGAMDRIGPYVDRSRRRLSTETGGSGDLFERMDRNRNRALAQRKSKQKEEARDEARRNRAKRNKQKEY